MGFAAAMAHSRGGFYDTAVRSQCSHSGQRTDRPPPRVGARCRQAGLGRNMLWPTIVRDDATDSMNARRTRGPSPAHPGGHRKYNEINGFRRRDMLIGLPDEERTRV